MTVYLILQHSSEIRYKRINELQITVKVRDNTGNIKNYMMFYNAHVSKIQCCHLNLFSQRTANPELVVFPFDVFLIMACRMGMKSIELGKIPWCSPLSRGEC